MFSNTPSLLLRYAPGVNATNQSRYIGRASPPGPRRRHAARRRRRHRMDDRRRHQRRQRRAAGAVAELRHGAGSARRVVELRRDDRTRHRPAADADDARRHQPVRGSANYQHWTNKLNAINPSQTVTFTPAGTEAIGRTAVRTSSATVGGPMSIKNVIDGRNKLFYFASFSYVERDHSRQEPADGHHSDERRPPRRRLLRSAAAAQPRAIPDLRSAHGAAGSCASGQVHPDSRSRTTSFRSHRIVKSVVRAVQGDGAGAQPESSSRRPPRPTTTTAAASRHPGHLALRRAARLQHLANDRFYFRTSGQPVLREPVRLDLRGACLRRPAQRSTCAATLVVPRRLDAFGRQHGHRHPGRGEPVRRAQQLLQAARLHAERLGLPAYMDEFCAARGDCKLPQVDISGYQGISNGAEGG